MLNKLKRFIGTNEPVQQKSEEIEQQQYIQYAQELEQSLSRLEAGVHESDDPSWIMQSVMKTALDFYKGDWIGFLEVDLELGLWTPTHWYNPSPNDKTLELLQEFESAEFLHRWVTAMHENTAIIVPTPREMVAIEKALSISLAMEQLKKQTGSAVYKYRKNSKE